MALERIALVLLLAWGCEGTTTTDLADRVWTGIVGSSIAGSAVDAMDGAAGDQNVLVAAPFRPGEVGSEGQGYAYRLAASTDSGPLEQVAHTSFAGADDSWGGGRHGVLFAGDLDVDGDPDVLVWDNQVVDQDHVSELSLYDLGARGRVGRSAAWGTVSTESQLMVRQPTPCGDLDADGFRDLCFAGDDQGKEPELVVFGPIGAGETHLPSAATATFRVPEGLTNVPIGGRDINGDGADDAVVSVAQPSGFYLVSRIRRGENDLAGFPYWRGAQGGIIVDDLNDDALADVFSFDRLFVDKEGGEVDDAWWTLELDFDLEIPRNVISGDLDGDGAADLVVATEQSDRLPWRLLVFRGPLPEGTASPREADLVIDGRSPQDWFGSAMASADVDADGRDDLVVGAPYDGKSTGSVSLFLGATLFP